MPICEADPWRFQYFENIPCPKDVLISTEDPDSWVWYPNHRWIYDKLRDRSRRGTALRADLATSKEAIQSARSAVIRRAWLHAEIVPFARASSALLRF